MCASDQAAAGCPSSLVARRDGASLRLCEGAATEGPELTILIQNAQNLQDLHFATQKIEKKHYEISKLGALVLSGSLGRTCSCIWLWQVLQVSFPGFSHLG